MKDLKMKKQEFVKSITNFLNTEICEFQKDTGLIITDIELQIVHRRRSVTGDVVNSIIMVKKVDIEL